MSANMITGYHDIYWADRDIDHASLSFELLGITGPEGIRQIQEREIEPITGDPLGETTIDAIYNGANLYLEFVLQEVQLDAVKKFLSWFRETDTFVTDNRYDNEIGHVGHLLSSYGASGSLMGTLEARPRAGTKAALANGGVSTRRYIGINIGPIEETLDTRLNAIPIRFQAFPFVSNSKTVLWDWQNSPT